jgi:hypothetical protein
VLHRRYFCRGLAAARQGCPTASPPCLTLHWPFPSRCTTMLNEWKGYQGFRKDLHWARMYDISKSAKSKPRTWSLVQPDYLWRNNHSMRYGVAAIFGQPLMQASIPALITPSNLCSFSLAPRHKNTDLPCMSNRSNSSPLHFVEHT